MNELFHGYIDYQHFDFDFIFLVLKNNMFTVLLSAQKNIDKHWSQVRKQQFLFEFLSSQILPNFVFSDSCSQA